MSTTTILFLLLVAAVGACRLIELRLSKRHQRALSRDALRIGVRVSGVDHHCRYSSIVRRPTTLTIRVSPSTRSGTGWP